MKPDWSASWPRPFRPLPSPTRGVLGLRFPTWWLPGSVPGAEWSPCRSPGHSRGSVCALLPPGCQCGNSDHGPQTPTGSSHLWAPACVLELPLCSSRSACSFDPWALGPLPLGLSTKLPPGALPSAHVSHQPLPAPACHSLNVTVPFLLSSPPEGLEDRIVTSFMARETPWCVSIHLGMCADTARVGGEDVQVCCAHLAILASGSQPHPLFWTHVFLPALRVSLPSLW